MKPTVALTTATVCGSLSKTQIREKRRLLSIHRFIFKLESLVISWKAIH